MMGGFTQVSAAAWNDREPPGRFGGSDEEGPVPVRRARFVALLTVALLCVTATASWARETERSRYGGTDVVLSSRS
jgi:hypothetical protein